MPDAIDVPAWAGYQAGLNDPPSTGRLEVEYHGERLKPAQRRAAESLPLLAAALQPKLLAAIVEAYPGLRRAQPRPPQVTIGDLRTLVRLFEVIVMKDDHESVAYVAYHFHAAWDPSGVDVMTHGDRVVAVGGTEVLRYPIADPARAAPTSTTPSERLRHAAVAAAEKAARKNPRELTVADDGELSITLPAWAGFCPGPGCKPSRGEIVVTVGDEMLDDDAMLTDAHRAAFRFTVEHAVTMQAALLAAIAERHPKRAPLRDLIDLMEVHIHHPQQDGVSYVGYELECAWEREHGLGVMTHRDRVVKVGAADVALHSSVANADQRKKSRE